MSKRYRLVTVAVIAFGALLLAISTAILVAGQNRNLAILGGLLGAAGVLIAGVLRLRRRT